MNGISRRKPTSRSRELPISSFLCALVFILASNMARAESVLRVAMTAGDIPAWAGQPDQGGEGFRFVGYSLYDPLVGWDLSKPDVEAALTPALATKWYIDPNDNKRWIFELRRGVTFHDGCAWNADAAIWNFNRWLDDKAPGYDPIQATRVAPFVSNIARWEKIDDYKIAIRTKEVESLFPYVIPRLLMISKCAMEKAGNNFSVFAQHPVGSGPYKFDTVTPHERLELVKNADYWNKDRVPKHDRLVLIPMPEASTRAAALLSGQVDFIEAPSPDVIDRLKAAGMKIDTNFYPHTWDYILDFARGPFQDLRVRQAANYAINRQEMVDLVNGTAIEAYGVVMPKTRYYGHPFEYRYAPDKATALLKEAKCYPCTISLVMSPSGSGQMQPLPMNELLKAQLEAVGFKVNFTVMDWNALNNLHRTPAAQTTYDGLNYSQNTSDPETGFLKNILTRYRTPVGTNWGWYQNAEIDKLGDEVMQTFDDQKRNDLLQHIHEIAVKDAEQLFVVDDLNPRALSPKLTGFVQAQSWYQDLTPIVVNDSAK
ncbi:MAG TPA: ABC transporter substrate-binding protein [Beijerinckiaceae bacterium]|nr:ABC transporter substrate-binding protein [Beijerinckiaceae bacterium]